MVKVQARELTRMPLVSRAPFRVAPGVCSEMAPEQLENSNHSELLGQKPLKSRLVNQVVGLFFVGKKVEGEAARGGYKFCRLFNRQVGLPEDIHHQVNNDLKAAHLPIFLADFGLPGHQRLYPNLK